MALIGYNTQSPGIIKQDFAAQNALALRGTTTGQSSAPPRTAWWFNSAGQKQSMPLTGELANATSVTSRNGQLVVNGPWGEKVFGGAGQAQPASASTEAPPKFDVIRTVKDPEIDNAATQALRGTQSSNAQANSLFQQYLNEFQKRQPAASARLDKELATYDTAAGDLEKLLATNLEEQRAGLAKARELNLKQLIGDDERYSLSRGPLGTGRSGEQERTFSDSYYRAILPYEQQLGALGRQNIGDVYNSRLSTAPLGRAAETSYLSSLITPATAASSIQNDALRNLTGAASLVQGNRFYTPWSDDPRLTPSLPTPSAQYSLPGIPNYGGYRMPVRASNPTPYGGQQVNQGLMPYSPGQQRRSAEEEAYKADFGYYPQDDPDYSSQRWESYGGRTGAAAGQSDGRTYQYYSGVDRAAREQAARAQADAMYREQTGADPNMDRNYNEEVWRSFYNMALNNS